MSKDSIVVGINLRDLTGCPDSVRELDCRYNQLKDLTGCPNSVQKLYCWNNQLKDLTGCGNSVQTLNCSGNQLKDLTGCPNSVQRLDCSGNPLVPCNTCGDYWEYQEKRVNHNFIHQVLELNTQFQTRRIQKAWHRYWYEQPLADGFSRAAHRCAELCVEI